MKIYRLKLRLSNAYLVIGTRPALIDSGSPGDIGLIRTYLRRHHVEFSDLSVILHTHAHSDHMGSTAEIAADAKCPVAYHLAEQPIVEQASNGRLRGIGFRGSLMTGFFNHTKFAAVSADFLLNNDTLLSRLGIDVCVIETPGHTPGSVSFLLPGGEAIIGDVLMGGFMGGAVLSSRPNFHYFAESVEQVLESVEQILSRSRSTLYVGHGGPLEHHAVASWLKANTRKR